MKILVTGREGQVATSLAERGEGRDLVFVARPEFDLADGESIGRVIGEAKPDLIISAAAYTAVDQAEDEPELAMAINGEAPVHIGRAAAAIGAPVLHLSTDYVFDGSGERAWTETDPTGPIGAYGKTKLAGEQALAASGATYAILRTAWVYSPFGNNFVKTMLRLADSRDALNVVADQHGNPTSALDIADEPRGQLDEGHVVAVAGKAHEAVGLEGFGQHVAVKLPRSIDGEGHCDGGFAIGALDLYPPGQIAALGVGHFARHAVIHRGRGAEPFSRQEAGARVFTASGQGERREQEESGAGGHRDRRRQVMRTLVSSPRGD